MTKLYGIKNCDTMKKAMTWLAANEVEYTFHDYKKIGLENNTLTSWINAENLTDLINRRGTTWRKLPDDLKEKFNEPSANNKSSANSVILENLSILKRPILDVNGKIYIGFSEKHYQEIFLNV